MNPRSLARRVVSLEKTAVRAGATCTCSGPLVVWDPEVRAVLKPNAPPVPPVQPASDRCRRCRRRREVIRVGFQNTLPLEPLP